MTIISRLRSGEKEYPYVNPPFKMLSNKVVLHDCLPNCLTALLSIYEVMYGFDLGEYSGNYEDLYSDLSENLDNSSHRFFDSINSFLKDKNLGLTMRQGTFGNTNGELDHDLICKKFLNFNRFPIPIIAIVDEYMATHGTPLRGQHSILLLGHTQETYIVYDPNRRNLIYQRAKTDLEYGWKPNEFQGLYLAPEKQKIQKRSTRIWFGIESLEQYLEWDENE